MDQVFHLNQNVFDNIAEYDLSAVLVSACLLKPVKIEKKDPILEHVDYYSGFVRLIKACCYVIRFILILRPLSKDKKFELVNLKNRPRPVNERKLVEAMYIRNVQHECYGSLYFYILSLGGQSCTSVKKSLRLYSSL